VINEKDGKTFAVLVMAEAMVVELGGIYTALLFVIFALLGCYAACIGS
jgi:hypothetical protein